MKRTAIAWVLVLCLMLSGCGPLLTGEYIWEQTHYIPPATDSGQSITASNYSQLLAVLTDCVESGLEAITVSVAQYDRDRLESDVVRAVDAVSRENPVAAYALRQITYELGSSGGEAVLVVQVAYLHDLNEILKIQTVADNAAAEEAIIAALRAYDFSVVLRVDSYEDTDFVQLVDDYIMEHPQYVMEKPRITANIYPETGKSRIVELKFDYVTSRHTLKNMQAQVATVFDASVDMVSVTVKPRPKYTQMYSLLMDRFQNYTIETSITPAFSLLIHGVGDAKAFAAVYAAMCREAGLECYVVTGMRSGALWYWNIICIDGVYYHVDLLRCKTEGAFREMTDSIIAEGYVWNFSAYPACGAAQE